MRTTFPATGLPQLTTGVWLLFSGRAFSTRARLFSSARLFKARVWRPHPDTARVFSAKP